MIPNYKIPYGKQLIDQKDIKSVIKVLKSDLITQGPQVPIFEKKICNYVSSKYAVAVNSATSALHIACLALDLKENDTLWTVPNTFVASSNCGLYCGSKIDFVDIDPNTWNISITKLEEKLKISKKNNSLPKILVSVHFAGQPTHQEKIKKLSNKYGFFIIEDASHSLGASRKSIKVGSCKWSDITVFSFHPVKMITTGEGGMALTNNKKLYSKLKMFREHGITRDQELISKKRGGAFYKSLGRSPQFEQQLLGYNYRMTDINAALGISQLDKITKFVKERNRIAKYYFKNIDNKYVSLQRIDKENYSSFHLFIIRLELDKMKKNYLEIFNSFRKMGIGVNLHYLPIHLHPYYQKIGFKSGDFPISEKYSKEAMTLPLFVDLKKNIQDKIILKINKFIY